jgi:hypothetical protein
MRRPFIRTAILALLVWPCCVLAATVQIQIKGMNFHPDSVTVAPEPR